jgi:hypothetical protein
MLISVFAIIAAAGALAAGYLLAAAGFRNGDRPGDALVSAVLPTTVFPTTVFPAAGLPAAVFPATVFPTTGRAAATAVVRNPSGTPVLVGLTARPARWAAWPAPSHDVSVPRWTLRGKFGPARYACVAVVPAGGAAELAVPAWRPRGATVLTVAVGQEGGRLRVHRLRLGPAGYLAEGRQTIMVA